MRSEEQRRRFEQGKQIELENRRFRSESKAQEVQRLHEQLSVQEDLKREALIQAHERAEHNRQLLRDAMEMERQHKIHRESEHLEEVRMRQERKQIHQELQKQENANKLSKSIERAEEKKHHYLTSMLKGHMLSFLKEEEASQAKIRSQKMQDHAAKKLSEKYISEQKRLETIAKEKATFQKNKRGLQEEFDKEKDLLLVEFEKNKRKLEHEASKSKRFQTPISRNKSILSEERLSSRSVTPSKSHHTVSAKRTIHTESLSPAKNIERKNLTSKGVSVNFGSPNMSAFSFGNTRSKTPTPVGADAINTGASKFSTSELRL